MSRVFNGTTDRIDWASPYNPTTSPISISAWIYNHTKPVNTQYILATHNVANTTFGVAFTVYAALARLDLFRNGTTLLDRISITDTVQLNTWANVIVTHTGVMNDYSTIHIYYNGVEVTYATGTNGATEASAAGKWSIGGRIYDNARNFDGNIAEVGVWNRVITPAEIAYLASGIQPCGYSNGLVFYWSGIIDSLIADPGGLGVASGTIYSASHPTMLHLLPASDRQKFTVPAENRTMAIPVENRTMVIPAENRIFTVPAENRTLIIPAEDRTLEV